MSDGKVATNQGGFMEVSQTTRSVVSCLVEEESCPVEPLEISGKHAGYCVIPDSTVATYMSCQMRLSGSI